MTKDRPVTGILLMLGFCVLAPLGDGLAKIVGDTVPLVQLIAVRFGVQLALLAPFAVAIGGIRALPRRLIGLTVLRTLLHIIGIGAMFLSLRFLPLAEAIAIAFVMPFILLLLGRFVLHEAVGPRRLNACLVGFGGTVMVIQPSFSSVGLAALLPLLVAFVFALFILVTRYVAREMDPITLQTLGGAMASALLLPVLLVFDGSGWVEFDPVMPQQHTVLLLLGLGIIGTVAHLLMTWSLRFAPATTLAPMQYLEIPVAAAFGWLLFQDFPNGLAFWGMAVVLCAGLYIVIIEQRTARGLARQARKAEKISAK
jgi:drug/metabolite transporter (DMT)-like permease